MKFGICTLNKDGANRQSESISLWDAVSIMDPAKHIEMATEAGFRHFELTCDINTIVPGMFDERKVDELLQLKRKHNLTYSVHLPLWSVELACPHPYIRDAGKNLIIDAINTMKKLEPEAYVLHATGALAAEFLRMEINPFFGSFIARHALQFSVVAIEEILAATGIPSRKIAVENIEFPFEWMEDVIKELDLSVCLDVGHILAGYSGNLSIVEFIDKYFERIEVVHLHDAYRRPNGQKEDVKDHLPLGAGDLDCDELLNALSSRGYTKGVILEMGLSEAIQSMKTLNRLSDIGSWSDCASALAEPASA